VAGLHFSTLYKRRQTDPAFGRRWAEAYELGAAPLERRAQAIALAGDPANMATVRALEVALRTRYGSLRHPGSSRAAAEIRATGDGTGSIRVEIGAPGVD
jgi:hypothetical protein